MTFGIVIGVGLPLYVFPPHDTPRKSDVIVVLGPPVETRVAFALRLAKAGFATRIVISIPPAAEGGRARPEACDNDIPGVNVECFTPTPFTTQGEAQMLKTLAEPWNIERAIVITNTPHLTRARLLFSRCFDGGLYVLTDSSSRSAFDWAYQYAYQSAAFIKAFALPEC